MFQARIYPWGIFAAELDVVSRPPDRTIDLRTPHGRAASEGALALELPRACVYYRGVFTVGECK